ncbi:UNVERIFIED_CONTAM: hypothetical protein FKN15_007605 [Acipenser sinensis]
MSRYYRGGEEVKRWDFPSNLVFARTDRILDRLLKIEELFASALDFLKLEKIELGGSRGKILSEMVYGMNEEFHDGWRVLRERKYDPLDYRNLDFLSDYTRFIEQNKDFDQRLGTVLNLAFQDSRGLESAFKLLQIFGTLLERPAINKLFAPNYIVLLNMFETEMSCCRQILESQREKVSIFLVPFVSVDCFFCNAVILSHAKSLETSEVDLVFKKCENILDLLDQHDEEVYTSWTECLDAHCNSKLTQPLLKQDLETGLYETNFDPAINIFETLYMKVKMFDDKKVFNGWFQVDIKPFKVSLMNVIKKWSWMFKEHLLDHVNDSVNELEIFIHETEKGLAKEITDGDYGSLVEIMGNLMAIRDRQITTDDHFKPLKSTADLLRTYGQQLPEQFYTQLEELPEKWKTLKKIAFTVKHEVAPLQANEVAVIRRKCVHFEIKQHEFREQFQNKIIFKIDVHNPYKFIDKVTNGQAFAWLSQLRHIWDENQRHCYVNICDAQFQYSYEYLGNTPRLVITPLTDRCYITLTQSLHLTMSGAPSGPAGTGKTETTKDLGRSLGIMVYVFNCSEQMDYKSIGNIYKGLSQTGVWGCFDEFNRISVEVLSVVAVQVKTIQDAIRNKKQRFYFLGEAIELKPSVGIFITLNPGYAGRTELPENLKALFRPCAMVIPDFELICEIMLVAEGFIDARLLARKFISLYTLCRELLSKQDHYDWGLRAIKSVLVVAGSLKRGDRNRPEDQVLMRALRDFNLPKIVTNDVPIFLGLISDLFPLLDVLRKRDLDLEQMARQSIAELRLQPEENFILKVSQLEELLAVRHSVFIVGNAGAGKSQILKTLHRTYTNMKIKPIWNDINPKAVTTDELFGFLHPSTREWKDGLFSSTMRELSSISHEGPKWIVLDGDIDPMWIESLNTVMDDNKVLTLASNERISLTSSMRLLFEISHLRAATPATVSRAGILYVNPQDLGWSPCVASWIDTRNAQSERANLTILFDKYVPYCLEQVRCNLKTITPIPENSMVQTLCSLLECLLTPENTPPDSPRELYETYFVFACVWAFGGALFQDQLIDYRLEFSRWWSKEMRAVKFPSQGTVFDYFIDPDTKKFVPWADKTPVFELEPDVPLQTVLVYTSETICLSYFVDLLLDKGKPVMLVGNAGVGKTILVSEKVSKLSEEYMVAKVPFNYYTTSAMLQRVLEKPLEKKAGRNYAPPGTKKLIYFIDDLNMPEVDAYGTVQPHTLIRQHLDYCHWYDRQKLSLKEIHNCQYITCMNPAAGSFSVNPRLQRHFSVFAVHFPGVDALATIYSSILNAHFQQGVFSYGVTKSVSTLIQAAICLHQKMTQNFLPTAIRFHYIFNLRDLSNGGLE